MSHKKVDFFIAGNSKSGTTALYHFLRYHSRICMSIPKEPNYFATDLCHDAQTGAFSRKTDEEYMRYFRDPDLTKLWGDASACYTYSKVAACEIYSHNPDSKIIIMIRDPVDFLFSYHLQMLKNSVTEGEVEKDFATALHLESDRKAGKHVPKGCLVPELLYYSERIKYTEQIERFFHYFPRSQVRIYLYDDFKLDNAHVYGDVLNFLGLRFERAPQFAHYNASEKLRSKTLQVWLYGLTHGEGRFAHLHSLIKYLTPRRVRRRLVWNVYRRLVFRPKPTIDPSLRRLLQARFRGEVDELSLLLDEDLVARWKYDDARAVSRSTYAIGA